MATGSDGYSVTITARDRASATLDQINKRIQRANAPVERLKKSFGNLATSTGIRDLSRELKGAANSASRLFAGVNGAGTGLAALGGGLGVAAMVEGAKRAGAYGNQLYLTAKAAGVGVGAVQRIGNTAAAAGGSFEGATGSLAELNKNMQLYAHSSTQTPADWKGAMGALHINVRNANGQMRSSSSVMDEILRKLAAMKSAQKRLYFGNALLGGSFKDSLYPAVARGSAALDRYEAISKRIVHLTPTQVSNLRALNSSFGVLGQNVEGVAEIAYAKGLSPGNRIGIKESGVRQERNERIWNPA